MSPKGDYERELNGLQTRLAAIEKRVQDESSGGFQRLSTVEERVAQMNKLWWALITGLLLNLALNGWQAYKLAQTPILK